MFSAGSRYLGLGTYTVTRLDGTQVTVTRLPRPGAAPVVGYHRRLVGQRLDHIAFNYLKDATGFWQLCDANGSMVPDSLAVVDLIAIPEAR